MRSRCRSPGDGARLDGSKRDSLSGMGLSVEERRRVGRCTPGLSRGQLAPPQSRAVADRGRTLKTQLVLLSLIAIQTQTEHMSPCRFLPVPGPRDRQRGKATPQLADYRRPALLSAAGQVRLMVQHRLVGLRGDTVEVLTSRSSKPSAAGSD